MKNLQKSYMIFFQENSFYAIKTERAGFVKTGPFSFKKRYYLNICAKNACISLKDAVSAAAL